MVLACRTLRSGTAKTEGIETREQVIKLDLEGSEWVNYLAHSDAYVNGKTGQICHVVGAVALSIAAASFSQSPSSRWLYTFAVVVTFRCRSSF